MTGIELQFTIALRYRNLLTRTLDANRLTHIDAKSVVVSRDNNALDLAARLGSNALTEEPSNPLSLEILGAPLPDADLDCVLEINRLHQPTSP